MTVSTVCLHILQVLAACLYPELMNSNKLPVDIKQRAQRMLEACSGSVGTGVCDIMKKCKTQIINNIIIIRMFSFGGVYFSPSLMYVFKISASIPSIGGI